MTREVYLIYTEYPIGKHAREMWKKHPEWTEYQAYCCLYWQDTARKEHRPEVEKAKKRFNLDVVTRFPEGHGVNVFDLFRKATGMELERLPRKITRLISLGGYRINQL